MVTSASIDRARRMFSKLIVKEENMLRNFAASNNYALSEAVMNKLALKIGRSEAYSLVKKAIKTAGSDDTLRDVIDKNESLRSRLTKEEIDALMDPANYVGCAAAIVDRSVKEVRKMLRK